MAHKSPVRSVDYALGDATFLVVTDAIMGQTSQVLVYDVRTNANGGTTRSLVFVWSLW